MNVEILPVRKRLFLGLLAFSLVGVGLLLSGIWYLVFRDNRTLIDQILLLALAGLLVGALVIACFGTGGIILTLLYARDIAVLRGPMRVALNLLFPIALALGRVFHIDQDRIKSSFIEVNNQLVRSKEFKLLPAQILVLAPHCLQWSGCPHKITVNIDNCRRCGRCPVNKLLALRDKYGIHVSMATGGTLARKFVREYRPRAIVAIACERDLTSGIQDSNPIPVLGITNERPFGPCFNTEIRIERVEEALQFFMRRS
ncbi:MAG TPA: DUF116 domain-containing protein [Bacillota bacterium]|nr:DUF116 domain-containing protein [Peptococcaceae bacterium MAG4]HPZ43761.1 DUF116 domain-containing protein [Bacillota bacterium]HQD76182.1 DUF116 domain-containing protein [Bacillota bacterium]HUM58884.1 DUF116 domain-containing protein [Bacillota bacterium]